MRKRADAVCVWLRGVCVTHREAVGESEALATPLKDRCGPGSTMGVRGRPSPCGPLSNRQKHSRLLPKPQDEPSDIVYVGKSHPNDLSITHSEALPVNHLSITRVTEKLQLKSIIF